MNLLREILPYLQIIFSVLLVTSILLQHSGADVGGAMGGSDNSFHSTRRGFEKFLFFLSITCAILFALSALLIVLLG